MSTEEQKYKSHPLFFHTDSSTFRNDRCSLDIGFSRSYVSRFFFTLRLPCVYIDHFTLAFLLLPIIFFSQFLFLLFIPEFPHSIRTWIFRRRMYSLSVAREAFPLTSFRVELFCFSAPRESVSPFRMFIPSFPSLSIPTSGLLSPLLSRSAFSFYGISYVRSSPPESALWIHPSFCMTKLPSLSLVPPTILWFVLSFLHALPPYSLLSTISQLVSSSSPNSRISPYTLVLLPFSRTKYSRSCFSRTRISRSPPLFATSSLVRASIVSV